MKSRLRHKRVSVVFSLVADVDVDVYYGQYHFTSCMGDRARQFRYPKGFGIIEIATTYVQCSVVSPACSDADADADAEVELTAVVRMSNETGVMRRRSGCERDLQKGGRGTGLYCSREETHAVLVLAVVSWFSREGACLL